VEYLVSFLLTLSLVLPFSKPLSRSSGSGTQAGIGSDTQTNPPPVCDPTTQNCS